jgi:DHA2 family multidrug resistance protein
MLPLLMQNLLGYTAYNSGLALSPRGIGAFVTTIIVGRVAGRYVSNRVVISTGVVILATASFLLGGLDLSVPMSRLAWLSVVNGVGVSMMFVPLATSTMGRLSKEEMSNATGIFNLMRNLGGSAGISALTTIIARATQAHQALLVHNIATTNPAYLQQLSYLKGILIHQANPVLAAHRAEALIATDLGRQASILAYMGSFRMLAVLCIAVTPLVFFLKRPKGSRIAMAH